MSMEKDFDLFAFLESMAERVDTPGTRVYPSFAKVNISTPKEAALRFFENMEKKYHLRTSDVASFLADKGSVATSFYLGVVDPEHLSEWEYYIRLYKTAGGKFPDTWVLSSENGSHKTITKHKEQGIPAPC